MRGAPAKAIQELPGHEDLVTTLRHTHLSPAARESAIALLNRRVQVSDWRHCGAAGPGTQKSSRIVVEAPGIDHDCTERSGVQSWPMTKHGEVVGVQPPNRVEAPGIEP
jgi:hypothetical protein